MEELDQLCNHKRMFKTDINTLSWKSYGLTSAMDLTVKCIFCDRNVYMSDKDLYTQGLL